MILSVKIHINVVNVDELSESIGVSTEGSHLSSTDRHQRVAGPGADRLLQKLAPKSASVIACKWDQ